MGWEGNSEYVGRGSLDRSDKFVEVRVEGASRSVNTDEDLDIEEGRDEDEEIIECEGLSDDDEKL